MAAKLFCRDVKPVAFDYPQSNFSTSDQQTKFRGLYRSIRKPIGDAIVHMGVVRYSDLQNEKLVKQDIGSYNFILRVYFSMCKLES